MHLPTDTGPLDGTATFSPARRNVRSESISVTLGDLGEEGVRGDINIDIGSPGDETAMLRPTTVNEMMSINKFKVRCWKRPLV